MDGRKEEKVEGRQLFQSPYVYATRSFTKLKFLQKSVELFRDIEQEYEGWSHQPPPESGHQPVDGQHQMESSGEVFIECRDETPSVKSSVAQSILALLFIPTQSIYNGSWFI